MTGSCRPGYEIYMPPFYKLVFFFVIWASVFIGSYYAFRYLNAKIKTSHTTGQLFRYSMLLFLICAVLFAGGILLLFYGYVLLV